MTAQNLFFYSTLFLNSAIFYYICASKSAKTIVARAPTTPILTLIDLIIKSYYVRLSCKMPYRNVSRCCKNTLYMQPALTQIMPFNSSNIFGAIHMRFLDFFYLTHSDFVLIHMNFQFHYMMSNF